jgi:hypothetical protein
MSSTYSQGPLPSVVTEAEAAGLKGNANGAATASRVKIQRKRRKRNLKEKTPEVGLGVTSS